MLNGWYKNANKLTPTLYQFTNDALQVNITLVIKTGVYSGFHYVEGIWTAYPDQPSMNAIWNAQFNGASPLPGGAVAKK